MNEMLRTPTGFYSAEACKLQDFADLVLQDVNAADVPHAAETPKNVPVYDMNDLRGMLDSTGTRRTLMAEWARVLLDGAGVIVLRAAYTDTSAIDAATDIFYRIIEDKK